MTNHEIIRTLKVLIHANEDRQRKAEAEALQSILDIFEHPDPDTVSRQAVLDAIMGEPTDAHYQSWYAERIKALPPSPSRPHIASLETPCDDCDVADKCTYESSCPHEAIRKAEHEGGSV